MLVSFTLGVQDAGLPYRLHKQMPRPSVPPKATIYVQTFYFQSFLKVTEQRNVYI